MRMSNVMDSDFLYACCSTSTIHFVVQIGLADRENAGVIVDAVQTFNVILLFICEELRHLNVANAIGCLGFCNNIFTINALIRLIDTDNTTLEINVFLG